MTHVKKISAIAAMLFFVGGSITLYAQDPQMSPPAQSPTMNQSPTPTQTQPSPQPTSPMDQQQTSPMSEPQTQQQDLNLNQPKAKANVSDEDLKEFASVYTKVQAEGQKAQEKMAAVIEKDGMKLDRFNEIQTAKLKNEKSDATPDEIKTFDKITGDLNAMQPDIQKGMETIIKSSGMSVEKFQAIASAIQTDQDVQARFQKIMGGGQSPS